MLSLRPSRFAVQGVGQSGDTAKMIASRSGVRSDVKARKIEDHASQYRARDILEKRGGMKVSHSETDLPWRDVICSLQALVITIARFRAASIGYIGTKVFTKSLVLACGGHPCAILLGPQPANDEAAQSYATLLSVLSREIREALLRTTKTTITMSTSMLLNVYEDARVSSPALSDIGI